MMAKHHDVTPDILYPTLYDVLMSLKTNVMSSLRVCLPATITAVHSAAGKVDVSIAVMQLDGQGIPTNYPDITGCPIITMQGGGVATVFPITAGDQCLIFFSDRCLDAWKKSGTATPLPFLRMHDLSDGFALVGVNVPKPFSTPLLTSTEGGIASAEAVIVTDNLTGLVSIRNQTQNLATSLDSLMISLSALVTLLGAMTTASIASGATQTAIAALLPDFVAVQTQLADLLY